MKKIGVYLSVGPHAGGSFQYCLSVLKYLETLDKKKVKILAFVTNNAWDKILKKNIKITKLNKPNKIELILNYLSIFVPANLIKFLLSKLSFNVRTLNSSKCDYLIFPSQENMASKINIKSITMIHDLMHRYERNFKEYDFLTRFKRDILYRQICNHSYKIIVDSSIGKKQVIESYNIRKKKVLISEFEVPHYLKKSKIKNIFKKYSLPRRNFIFYPAQFWEHKNHINLLKAFNLIQKKIKNINLVFVGVNKNSLIDVKIEIDKLNLSKKVFILGYVSQNDMYSFYKKASLTSFVSFCGPTNIPPLEAMFTGCPLICSNAYGMKKQIKGGGLLINPSSYGDIYKKIILVLKDKKIKKRIIRRGFEVTSIINKTKFLKQLDRYFL